MKLLLTVAALAGLQLTTTSASSIEVGTSGDVKKPIPKHMPTPTKYLPWHETIQTTVDMKRRLEEEANPPKSSTTTSLPTVYKNFIAYNDTQTCTNDKNSNPFDQQVRGANFGGWMVLEPWITPSLFYQFLGKGEEDTGADMKSFCEVLGPVEGNRQLRQHWKTWVTKEHVRELAEVGKVNSMRLPVGDFMYEPYGPFIGCTDGALEFVDDLLDWCHEYNVTILLDVHTMKDSQNGFDNSGESQGWEWTTEYNTYPQGMSTFMHWPIRTASWMGDFNRTSMSYPVINHANIAHARNVIQKMVDRYQSHPAILGLEPLNEPWEHTPINLLKQFYWDAYLIVKQTAPHWRFVMHDSFRFDVNIWGGFMSGCPDRALDTHIYQAWNWPGSKTTFYEGACSARNGIGAMEVAFGPVIVGEWSLATDNCAMWLNGFNDNNSGYPMMPCKYVECGSVPYMGDDQPGAPVDPSKPKLGPFGTGESGPSFGLCPVDRDWSKETDAETEAGDYWRYAPAKALEHRDATDEVMTLLARKKIHAFSGVGHGFYFWNFRTDLYEPQWNYMQAVERGWISNADNLSNDHINTACKREDSGEGYNCVSRRKGVARESLFNGVFWSKAQNTGLGWGELAPPLKLLNMTELEDEGDIQFNRYWKRERSKGATCDFGGAAMLTVAATTDDEFTDDWVEDVIIVKQGVSASSTLLISLLCIVVGGMFGFVSAMKRSAKFNVAVRKTKVLRSVRNSAVFTSSRSLLGSETMPLIN